MKYELPYVCEVCFPRGQLGCLRLFFAQQLTENLLLACFVGAGANIDRDEYG